MSNNRIIEVIIHCLVWTYAFASPLIFIQHGESFNWIEYSRCVIIPAAACLLFYINYFWLIPQYFMRHHMKSYIVINLALITVLAFSTDAAMQYTHALHAAQLPDGLPTKHHYGSPKPLHGGMHHKKPGYPHQRFFLMFVMRNFVTLLLSAVTALAIRLVLQWRNLEVERQKLQLQRTDAQLQSLKSQTSPHFLLNTLNNIYSLTAFDTDKAQHAILELSKMLRYQLYESDAEKVLVRKEAAFLNNYIELMRLRLGENVDITFTTDIAPDESIVIAPHILICLVENAFKHGVSANKPSFIHIALHADLNDIHFVCTNSNHPQSKASDKTTGGIGFHQVAQRLQLVYPGYHAWTHGPSDDGKTYTSEITIYNDAL